MLEVVSEIPAGQTEPQGFVVANDVDMRRACMLVHQCKRINSCALLVTNHPGQEFPMPAQYRNDGEGKEGMFDRVLCDVPCTGDGTVRKNPTIFKSWTASQQINIHSLQVQIAMRGIRVCKVGGLMCYSTCSMSPYENEASVAELLRLCDGALEVVDVNTIDGNVIEKGFVGRPGMSTWRVFDDRPATVAHFTTGETIDPSSTNEEGSKKKKVQNMPKPPPVPPTVPKYDNDPANWTEENLKAFREENKLFEYKTPEDIPPHLRSTLKRSIFPPTPEEVAKFNLHRCLRILPQDQDTGGFFVTLFRKTAAIGSVKRKPTAEQMAASNAAGAESDLEDTEFPEKAAGFGGKQISEEFKSNQSFVPVTTEMSQGWLDWYGLKSPSGDPYPQDQFFARTESARAICFLPRNIVNVMQADLKKSLRIVHSGLQVFEKNTKGRTGCDYRLSFEGLGMLAPYVTKRRIEMSDKDFTIAVKHCVTAPGAQIDNRQFSEKLQEELKEVGHGCFLATVGGNKVRDAEKILMVMWCNNHGLSSHALVFKTDLEGVQAKLQSQGMWVDCELDKELYDAKVAENNEKVAENKAQNQTERKEKEEAAKAGEAPPKKRSRQEDDPVEEAKMDVEATG